MEMINGFGVRTAVEKDLMATPWESREELENVLTHCGLDAQDNWEGGEYSQVWNSINNSPDDRPFWGVHKSKRETGCRGKGLVMGWLGHPKKKTLGARWKKKRKNRSRELVDWRGASKHQFHRICERSLHCKEKKKIKSPLEGLLNYCLLFTWGNFKLNLG